MVVLNVLLACLGYVAGLELGLLPEALVGREGPDLPIFKRSAADRLVIFKRSVGDRLVLLTSFKRSVGDRLVLVTIFKRSVVNRLVGSKRSMGDRLIRCKSRPS